MNTTTSGLMRELATECGNCFLVTPYGIKTVSGEPFDFDRFHRKVTEAVVAACGMTIHRADSIYGPAGVLDAVWRGIQKAEVVIVDFTGRSPNVAIEFAWAMLLGKRLIILIQDESDIPTDVRGLYRYITYSENFDAVDRMKEELTKQLGAIREEAAAEKMLSPMDVVGGVEDAPGQVIAVDPEFVTIKTDSGRHGILGNADVQWERIIRDMSRRFRVGDRLDDGAFVTDRKGTRYSLIARKANPWRKLISDHPPGSSLTSEVRNVIEGSGAFIAVGHGINGRVRSSGLVGHQGLVRGDRVEVTVDKIDPDRRQVALRLDRVIDRPPTAAPAGLPALGTCGWGEICAVKPGYVLLKIAGRERPAMLLSEDMSKELRHDFDILDLKVGEDVYVEVARVDSLKDKVYLKDMLAPEEPDLAAPAAA